MMMMINFLSPGKKELNGVEECQVGGEKKSKHSGITQE